MDIIRVATLGAARITPAALIKPSRLVSGVEVAAIAARDRDRATAFATKHGVPRVLDSYDDVIADPDIDAIYNPLPNGLHGHWTVKAIEAGKHVLCEKPFTANADEAEQVAAVAGASDRVVMEAFHYRYHPLAARLAEIIESGEIGPVRRIQTWVCIPLPMKGDIRFRLDLAGGSLMDTGCYAIHLARLAGAAAGLGEPEVVSANAKLSSPGVDRWATASLSFPGLAGGPGGAGGQITCALFSGQVLRIAVRVTGERGRVDLFNPLQPKLFHRLVIRSGSTKRAEKVPGDTTYTYQLRAFVAAISDAAPVLTPPSDSIANMRVIDAVYRAAGLAPREPSTP